MGVLSFKLKERPHSGDGMSREHVFLLSQENMTDDQVVDWLTDTAAVLPAEGIQRPDDSIITSLPPGESPLLFEYAGRPLTRIQYEIQQDADPEFYEITARYSFEAGGGSAGGGGAPITGTAGIEYSFDFGPENETIKQSLLTVGKYPSNGGSGFAPITNGAINIQPDGSVEGTKVADSPMQFTLRFTESDSFFTEAKRALQARLRGHVNSTTFQGYQAGEVRFLGASGSFASNGQSSIDFRFGVRQNVTSLQLPGIDETSGVDENDNPIMNGIVKNGWDYLWVFYGFGEDAGKVTSNPRGAFVERLFFRSDLNTLFT